MSQIVIHAGMPKTGSSSIQDWLASRATDLRKSGEACILVVRCSVEPTGARVRVAQYSNGVVNSGRFIELYSRRDANKEAMVDALIGKLDHYADRWPIVVVSSEAFAQPFWKGDGEFLDALDSLASRHRVRVAYYVRPQHTALEAAWKQWGFRTGRTPAEYLRQRAQQLFYFDTYCVVRARTSRVSFEPRPYRSDLLDLGDVVADFIGRFLGQRADARSTARLNPSLPLGVANALRAAPPGLLWNSPHDNRMLDVIKAFVSELQIPDDQSLVRSRLILQRYCHAVFEPGNTRLASELGWANVPFVPPVDTKQEGEPVDLSTLDELWTSRASEAELSLLHHALAGLVARDMAGVETVPSAP